MAPRRILIITENAPVPGDRRVWNESRTLAAAGWEVVIVAPARHGTVSAPYELLEGIEIHRYPLRPSEGGARGYLREYGQAMWRIRKLVRRLTRERRFDVVHACNPPDFCCLPREARGDRAPGTYSTITTSLRSFFARVSPAARERWNSPRARRSDWRSRWPT